MKELVEVEVQFCHETEKAWMVFNHHKVKVSLPKSQVELPDDPVEGKVYKLDVPAWIAESKDLC